ncbi:hypothetical protein DENSPDRAFT_765398, partial [Dentipellis sp. KUC8613]
LRQGYLGSSPYGISVVISLRTLELYRILRLRQPRLSIQAWIQSLCDLHNVNYRRTYWRHFSEAFDVYLKILREVETRVAVELQRSDDPHWRVKHSCPACRYKLVDDPTMDIEFIGSLDGNQSLKRVRLREGFEGDPRVFHSGYYIREGEVETFKHDVKPRSRPAKKKDDALKPKWGPDEDQVAAADGETACADRWKAAMNDALKRMWAIYRETGIFASACRHHLLWWICDMIESGELAKYPIAHVSRVLHILGYRPGIGYDIGCSFDGTISRSSLKELASERHLRFAVPAFHGYAHNRLCQLHFHPLYITGFGLEDMETCERIFSAFNGLAVITRHASQFHRHQAIDMFAKQWDADKYRDISLFLLNNYKQVQNILDELPDAIKLLQSGKSSQDLDYAKHLEAERLYLAARKKDSPQDARNCEYVSLLIKHRAAESLFAEALKHLGNPKNAKLRPRLEKDKRDAFDALDQITTMLADFERSNDIVSRWTPDSEEWKATADLLTKLDYQKALDKLEGLVVQRLFELAKMGLSGTGKYFSLKTRCRAIQTALAKYNAAAKKLDRPSLEWKDISTYGGLAEFELLRECREDIRAQPWTDSRNRQAAVHTLRLERAGEERDRLNIEIRRLATWMCDEERQLRQCVNHLKSKNPHLAAHVATIEAQTLRVNDTHRFRLREIAALPCFTGRIDPGV